VSGRYLLDTHTFAWAVGDASFLSGTVRGLLEDPDNAVLVSAASIWEMSIKHHLGKWPEVAPYFDEELYAGFLSTLRATELPIRHAHARLAGQWAVSQRDPFDRMLAAQAVIEGIPVLSNDVSLDQFSVARLW
jgi:PIN domain nuclease of toxin-antitoxin system